MGFPASLTHTQKMLKSLWNEPLLDIGCTEMWTEKNAEYNFLNGLLRYLFLCLETFCLYANDNGNKKNTGTSRHFDSTKWLTVSLQSKRKTMQFRGIICVNH